MKLLLTSTGLTSPELKEFFIGQFDRLDDKKVCLIHTIRTQEDWQWLPYYNQELGGIGLAFDKVNISEEKELSALPEYDVYYVCGGNTYYILDRLRKTGMDKVLVDAVQKGKLYHGVSAGAIIAGPDIEIAGCGESPDENDIDLQDLTGLKFTNSIVSPHFNDKEEKDIAQFEKRRNVEVTRLNDGEGVFISDNSIKFIGK